MSDGLSVRDVSKKHPLHWPGIIWVVICFLQGGYGVIYFLLVVFYILSIKLGNSIPWPTKIIVQMATMLFIITPLSFTAAITMLRSRRAGWFTAIILLAVFLANNLIRMALANPFQSYTLKDWIHAAAVFIIGIVFLVYFIKARRRYGVVS
jgi:uncharacterized membrane protein YhaH (DUF805 family)